MWHRLWQCKAPEAAKARKAIPKHIVAEALRAGPASRLFSNGWVSVDPSSWPDPEAEECIQFERWCPETGEWIEMDDVPAEVEGDMYVDGSSYPGQFGHQRRGGWAILVVSASHQQVFRCYGPLWSPMDQSAPAAEWAAATLAARMAARGATIYSDCLQVVRGLQRARLTASRLGAYHDGFLRTALLDAHGRLEVSVQKVKAHQTRASGPLTVQATLNNAVDELAKQAAKMHAGPSPRQERENNHLAEVAKQVYRCMAALLPIWPTVATQNKGERLSRRARTARKQRARRKQAASVPAEQRHQWAHVDRGWRCVRCHAVATCCRTRRAREKVETCIGSYPPLAQVVAEPRGHRLRALVLQGTTTLLCSRCGCHATTLPRGLASDCSGRPKQKGREALARYAEGKHPSSRSEALVSSDVPLFELELDVQGEGDEHVDGDM